MLVLGFYKISVESEIGNYDVGIITPEKLEEDQIIQFVKDNNKVNVGDIHNIYNIKELTRDEYNEEFGLSYLFRVTYISNEGETELLGYYTMERFYEYVAQHKLDNDTDKYLTESEFDFEKVE